VKQTWVSEGSLQVVSTWLQGLLVDETATNTGGDRLCSGSVFLETVVFRPSQADGDPPAVEYG
jgi:hypothetical protein